jgi:hypothetical protein
MFAEDAVMATAVLNPLLHHCTILNFHGESYRLKEKRQAGSPLDQPVRAETKARFETSNTT